jgi:hypothetical protein
VIAATTSIYSYDENDKRVRIDDGLTVFHYPNNLYQADSLSGVPTKHIQLNGRDIAVLTGPTGSSTITYSFPDNQNSGHGFHVEHQTGARLFALWRHQNQLRDECQPAQVHWPVQ